MCQNGHTKAETLVDSTPTHNRHQCSTVCSQARKAHHALGLRPAWLKSHGLHFILVRLKGICHLVWSMSHPCCWLTCRSPRAHHLPHSLFLLPLHTRTRSTIGTTWSSLRTPSTPCASPSSRSRQAAPSSITLAWRPAEWRKPAHHNSHRLWAQRACDCLKDRRFFWRSISITWCTGKFGRRSSPSSDHGRSEARISETSYDQSQTPFDDFAESTADSDLEDGELQKMLTSPLYAQKA